jgi:hypothetical protein
MASIMSLEEIRKKYPSGTRVVLDRMDDVRSPRPGTVGTVGQVDDAGQVHVHWDDGSSLALIVGTDEFHVA